MSFEVVAILVASLLVMCGAVGALLGAILILKPSDKVKDYVVKSDEDK